MFDLGIQEIVMIFVVALLVFGPKNLPELATKVGKFLGGLRKILFDFKTQMHAEMGDDHIPLRDEMEKINREIAEIKRAATETIIGPPQFGKPSQFGNPSQFGKPTQFNSESAIKSAANNASNSRSEQSATMPKTEKEPEKEPEKEFVLRSRQLRSRQLRNRKLRRNR
ncbi:MAG: twin-arginine translocase TatA/TatE family subunit [Nitrospirae bacterium]|nr:twin-arginine translocase TatA/TatE family subunit [Nitrospirota bacterium]